MVSLSLVEKPYPLLQFSNSHLLVHSHKIYYFSIVFYFTLKIPIFFFIYVFRFSNCHRNIYYFFKATIPTKLKFCQKVCISKPASCTILYNSVFVFGFIICLSVTSLSSISLSEKCCLL